MSSDSAVVCVLDNDEEDSSNQNISQMISTLRTSFRTKDFDQIEEILISRELKLKRELNKQKSENEKLKRLVVLEKAAQDAAQVGERKAVERYEKLLEEVKTGGLDEDKAVILELKKKCCVLECSKIKAESEVELWKRRFEELGIRVSKLEEDTALLMDMGPQVSKKCGDNSSVKEKKCSSGKGRVENGTNSVDVSIRDNGFDCDENTSVAAGAGLNLRSPTKTDGDLQSAARPTSTSRAFVDILDSDDDVLQEEFCSEKKRKTA